MSKDIKTQNPVSIEDFRLPRYNELPDVGLYLEQVIKYINGYLVPLGCTELTSSMVSNYVKKGVISSPVKKQYSAEQIGYLFFVAVAKNVITIESIIKLIDMQKSAYEGKVAYNYFCDELESMLCQIYGIRNDIKPISERNTEQKMILRSVVIAASHIIYLNRTM